MCWHKKGHRERLKYFVILLILVSITYAQTGARYLVITPDYFYNALQPLVEWKYKKGMKPAVYKTSQVGSDSVSIRNFIQNCYNTWDITPEFVVIVGHPGYIPMCYYQYGSYHYYTDNYYSNMDGDVYNEIIPGRLSVSDVTQLTTIINKVLAYERYPLTSDSLWFKKGSAIANCDGEADSMYLSCMRYAESLAVHNGFAQVDTFCNYHGNNASNVISAINQGRMFVLYRGNANNHWYNPFDVNPYNAWNGTKLPIIISTTCRTVSPNSSPVLGENFLRVGTPTSLRGAVGFYGGTRNIDAVAHLRNAVAMGFLDALFVEGKRTFGEVGEGGRLRVYQQYGEVREYNNFTCLGDPELNLWTDTPCSLEVQHPAFAPFGSSNLVVNVSDAANSTPVSDAFVCIAGKIDSTVYLLDTTDVNGSASFNIDPQIIDDTLFVTVTGKNLQPYEGFMIVRILNYCYIVYLNSSVNDSASGNNDHRINPTEEIELPLWVYNLGESTGVSITGTLRSGDVHVIITDSVKIFGDIPGYDSAYTGQDGYNFSVCHSCPNTHQIDFELICSDTNDSTWVSNFTETVYAPDFILDNISLSGGNGNNTLEPAETVDVVVTIMNQGDAAADSVYAVLRCQGSQISVIDSTGTFGHIGIDSLQDNNLDPFIVSADSGTPIGTIVNLEMLVFSNYCNDTLRFDIVVGQKHYYLWNPDPTSAPGQNMHAILGTLGFVGDYGTILPTHLDMYQTLFACLGVYSNRHVITQNSAEAIALTDYLNNGGMIYLEGSSAWFIDPQYNNGHNFGPLFGISATTWSYADMGPISGQSGTFANSMYFNYDGENSYMDHVDPAGSGFLILWDSNNNYNCGVANDPGLYRTVGTSFELGLLADGSPPSTRAALLDSIMRFFGIPAPGIEEDQDFTALSLKTELYPLYPNPFRQMTEIRYQLSKEVDSRQKSVVSIEIYDVSGRLVRQFDDPTIRLSGHIAWYGDDNHGRALPAGIYFVRLEVGELKQVEKAILVQ